MLLYCYLCSLLLPGLLLGTPIFYVSGLSSAVILQQILSTSHQLSPVPAGSAALTSMVYDERTDSRARVKFEGLVNPRQGSANSCSGIPMVPFGLSYGVNEVSPRTEIF